MNKVRKFVQPEGDTLVPLSIATRIERHGTMLTPKLLAGMLAISPKTLYGWAARGMLPTCTVGSSLRFDPTTTAAWVRERTA